MSSEVKLTKLVGGSSLNVNNSGDKRKLNMDSSQINFHDYTVAFQHSRTDNVSCMKKLYMYKQQAIDRGVAEDLGVNYLQALVTTKQMFILKLKGASNSPPGISCCDVLTNFVPCLKKCIFSLVSDDLFYQFDDFII